MDLTVKQLSEATGVTVRALHYYEEAGILKPAYYGANGYRYYTEEEFLQLQQIFLFKELGYSIKQIQKVMGRKDFDKLSSLHSHKKAIKQEISKFKKLLKHIDKTIMYLEGKIEKNDKYIFDSMTKFAKKGAPWFEAEQIMIKSYKYTDNPLEPEKMKKISNDTAEVLDKLVTCVENGMTPESKEVQQLIKKHYQIGKKLHVMSKEVYLAIAELYKEHPTFKKQIYSSRPKLAKFLPSAMTIFANNEL